MGINRSWRFWVSRKLLTRNPCDRWVLYSGSSVNHILFSRFSSWSPANPYSFHICYPMHERWLSLSEKQAWSLILHSSLYYVTMSDGDGDDLYLFECPQCEEELEVDETMKQVLIEKGCVMCSVPIPSCAFHVLPWVSYGVSTRPLEPVNSLNPDFCVISLQYVWSLS